MAGSTTVSKPTATACPECGSVRAVAEGLNTVRVAGSYAGPIQRGIATHNTEFWALVCRECGHTTFYAKNPERL